MNAGPNIIAFEIGNTRTTLAHVIDGEIGDRIHVANDEPSAAIEQAAAWWPAVSARDQPAVLIATVNEPVANRIRSALEDQLGCNAYIVGEDLPIPIGRQLDPETITGVDRLLNAAAAYASMKQACVVVDAGTAITVDFVDGDGTFHGGAIAPGAQMQLDALHRHTDALPELTFRAPDSADFGRSTADAMMTGVFHGIRGMVWRLVEHYAQAYGAYPPVVATGGDAALLFESDELIDRIVPDLALHGIVVAARQALEADVDSAGE